MGAVVALFRLGLLAQCRLVQGIGLGNHVVAALIKILQNKEQRLRSTGVGEKVNLTERSKVLQSRAWESLKEEQLVVFYRQLFDFFCNKNHELEFASQALRHPLTPWKTLWNTVLSNAHQLPQGLSQTLCLSHLQTSSADHTDRTPVFSFTGYDGKAQQLVAFTNDEKAPIHIGNDHTVRCYLPQETLSVSILATATGLPRSLQKQYYDPTVTTDKRQEFPLENASKVDRYGLALSHLYWLKLESTALIVIDGCRGDKDWNSRHIDALLCGPRMHKESLCMLNDRVISPFESPGSSGKTSELLQRLANSDTRMDAEDADLLVHAANWGYALTVFYHGQPDQRSDLGASLLDTALPDLYEIVPTLFKRRHQAIHIEDGEEEEDLFDRDDEKRTLL
jgi:hypothetical protein